MKNFKLLSFLMLLAASFVFIQCTSDPIPGPQGAAGTDGTNGVDGVDGASTGPSTSTSELLSKKVFLGPVIDGVIDASWYDCQQLTTQAEVPNPVATDGTVVFQGYVGDQYDVVVRSQYDSENVYFLAEWKDARYDGSRDTWYFDPADKLWKQESNKPVFDAGGNMTREAFYEDKFGMQFAIGTVTDWDTKTCYATCHVGANDVDGGAHHYAADGEQTDMWHWKSTRTGLPTGQFDDKHVTDLLAQAVIDGGTKKARAGDSKISGGHTNNVQTLNNGTADVKVPKYYIPGKTDYYWILESEVADNTAKLITAVDANGVLTDEDGNTIDPNTDLDFQRPVGGGMHDPALKGMPSITTTAFVGSRGDLVCGQTYTGNGWILEWKRPIDTGNADDVAFDITKEYPFGLAIFDNAAIAHAIKPYLNFKFEQ
ncbi:MAG: ethylbenzene dehydrogenase-related protein [Lutibacter sp.]